VEPHEPGNEWVIGLEPFMQRDYGVLFKGREVDFAVRVDPVSLVPAQVERPHVLWLGNHVYRIAGTVLARDDGDLCALDFGLLGYTWFSPEWMRPGTGVTGEVALEPDGSAYCIANRWRHELPAMIYPWRIDRIDLEHAERIPASEEDCISCGNPKLETNSPDRRTLREIQLVNWEKDRPPGTRDQPSREMGRYLLHCTLLSRIPRMPEDRDLPSRRDAGPTDA
jgi:hypothetical protein